MFGFGKKKSTEVIAAVQEPEEMLGLREYVSIDSIKAHLVDLLEENRQLKQREEQNRSWQQDKEKEMRKKAELAQIEADEYKKRWREEQQKANEEKRRAERLEVKLEEMTAKYNDLVVKEEMQRKAAEEAEKAQKKPTNRGKKQVAEVEQCEE